MNPAAIAASATATLRLADEHGNGQIGQAWRALEPWITNGKMVDRARN